MKLLFSLAMAWALSLAVNAATVSFSGITSTNAVKTNDLLLVDSALGGTNYATRTATIATLQSALSIPTVPTGLVSNSVAQSGLLAVDATKTNGVAATFGMVTNALGYAPQPTNANLTGWSAIATNQMAPLASPALTGTPTINGSNAMVWPTQLSLTHAGTVTLDLTTLRSEGELSLTGNVTLASANLAAYHQYVLYGRNTQATNCTPTFPIPSWQWQGGPPSFITAGKTFTIQLNSRGTTDTNVWAWYTESQ